MSVERRQIGLALRHAGHQFQRMPVYLAFNHAAPGLTFGHRLECCRFGDPRVNLGIEWRRKDRVG